MTIAAIATGVAVLSFLLSGFVYLRQRRTESRAHFTAEWENHERPVFINHGPGAAQNVEAELAGNMRPALPLIPYIGPFQATPMEVSQRHSGPEIDALTITWTDNRGTQSIPIYVAGSPHIPHSSTPRDPLEKTVRELAQQEIESAERNKTRRLGLFRHGG